MSIAILATGDELIQGDTLNTNSHAIAQALSSEGLPLGLHLVCGDQEPEIFDCIKFLAQKHDCIILTGGLGPTSDDRTRFALARFLNIPLIEFPDALTHIQNRLKQANLTMNSGNHQQAMFPESAMLLANPNGTAMGCYFVHSGITFILLPGPPRECLPMFNAYVLPHLQRMQHVNTQQLKWRLFGVAEGEIAQILDSALATVECETGYRLETPYVEFKVRCKPTLIDRVRDIVEPLVSPHIIAAPEHKASERLRDVIRELQVPIVIIDEVTGGVLQNSLQRPENYFKLSFSDNINIPLRFYVSGLAEYWGQLSGSATTQLTIKYQNNTEQGSESHQIPYRSNLVIYYAAEWLSFRLLHLINQLHK